jgi:hypothetical protein
MFDAQNENYTKRSCPCSSSALTAAKTAITAFSARRNALQRIASPTASQPPPSAKTSPDPCLQGNLRKRARTGWPAPLSFTRVYLQPEHESQQSADAQHDVCAAFAVPVNPSAITAINRATFNVFIVFSLEVERVIATRTQSSARGESNSHSLADFSKCEGRALAAECRDPFASVSHRFHERGRIAKEKLLRGPAPEPPPRQPSSRAKSSSAFESAPFPSGSTTSHDADFSPNSPDCDRVGSKNRPRRSRFRDISRLQLAPRLSWRLSPDLRIPANTPRPRATTTAPSPQSTLCSHLPCRPQCTNWI